MLTFRWMVGAILLSAAYVAVVVSSMGENVSIWSVGPRTALAIAAAPRNPPLPDVRAEEFTLPQPVALPARAARPAPADARLKPRAVAQKEEVPINPFQLFFPMLFDAKGRLQSPFVPD